MVPYPVIQNLKKLIEGYAELADDLKPAKLLKHITQGKATE